MWFVFEEALCVTDACVDRARALEEVGVIGVVTVIVVQRRLTHSASPQPPRNLVQMRDQWVMCVVISIVEGRRACGVAGVGAVRGSLSTWLEVRETGW